jgi:hypothetical protein
VYTVYCKHPPLQSLLQDAGLMHHRCRIWLTGNQGLQRKYVVRDGLAAAAAAAAAAA